MAEITRRIGLSLGADLCWPICYEEILRRWNPRLRVGTDIVRFEVERVTIEPFDLRAPCRYDLVLDRLTHWYHLSREWIKKAVVMDGLYVLNNPWSIQSMEKQTTYAAMMHLGLPVPDTWMIPPKEYDPLPDLRATLERYAKLFDLGEVGRNVGYPHFMKPYDGGAWVAVSRIDDEKALRDAYEKSGKRVMHLQKAVRDFDLFVRALGVGPQVRFIRYDPQAPLHERYLLDRDFLSPEEKECLTDMTLCINAFFGWDFNSCEVLRKDATFYPIDFANACPDSQVTSLHYHFPWLLKAMLRWSLFCAATARPMRRNLDWAPYYEARSRKLPYRESLRAYGEIAKTRFDEERFEEFCSKHFIALDDVAWEFFGSERAKEAVRAKVEAIFPEHEHERFTEHFWERIQMWRRDEEKKQPA
ncbi:MAG TPA: hypothetical protein VLK65_26075 [Vicinamibacteria bacterium]|nr:hypothetical protein [Vicinamibacteria bacterium]